MVYYIRSRVPQEEMLAQLAEEAAELTHAALKLRRVLDGANPTPVSSMDALQAVKEEIADVTLLVQLLGLDYNGGEIEQIRGRKLRRWVSRLEDRKAKAAPTQAALARMEVMPK